MPPKPKYTREEVTKAALDMVRESGIDFLTARDLGKRLGTSTRPIFTAFENMDDLKISVTDAGLELFKSYAVEFTDYTPAFKRMGMQIVSFAKDEPNLFELLFIKKNSEASDGLKDMREKCVEIISKEHDLNHSDAKMLFEQVWIFTFGLATLLAMKVYDYSEEEISDMLTRGFTGAIIMMKSGNKKVHTDIPKKMEG